MPKLNVSNKLMRAVAHEAPQFYTSLPYHNYGHIEEAETHFDTIHHKLTPLDVDIDYRLGCIAIKLHDAGFHEDHTAFGFSTKEDYSAALAADLLTAHGASDDIVEAVQGGIRATHCSAVPTTNLDKAVRMADIGNVFGDKITFMSNFILLTQEAIVMGAPVADSFSAQCLRSKTFLESYLKDPVTFTTKNGSEITLETEFSRATCNLSALGHLTIEMAHKMMPKMYDFCPSHWLSQSMDKI